MLSAHRPLCLVLMTAGLAACGSSAPATREPVANQASSEPPPAPAASFAVVSRTAAGGEIALRGPRERALPGALEAMKAHCPDFQIVQEGEQEVGADTIHNANGSQEVEVHIVEWRIHYQCAPH